jgi:hypothetical protein
VPFVPFVFSRCRYNGKPSLIGSLSHQR